MKSRQRWHAGLDLCYEQRYDNAIRLGFRANVSTKNNLRDGAVFMWLHIQQAYIYEISCLMQCHTLKLYHAECSPISCADLEMLIMKRVSEGLDIYDLCKCVRCTLCKGVVP